jgi:hypothetical protein
LFGGDRHHMPFNDLYLMKLWGDKYKLIL